MHWEAPALVQTIFLSSIFIQSDFNCRDFRILKTVFGLARTRFEKKLLMSIQPRFQSELRTPVSVLKLAFLHQTPCSLLAQIP